MQMRTFLKSELCVGCHACETACKMENDIELGPRWIKVRSIAVEQKPSEWKVVSRPVKCDHCSDSPCFRICPVQALRRTDNGTIQVDSDKCIGCKLCLLMCPFSVPTFDSHYRMTKCHQCENRVSAGLRPACVDACPMGALEFVDPGTWSKNRREGYLDSI